MPTPPRPSSGLTDRRIARGSAVLFRCDGTVATGLGHLSRCLALAEALEELGCACAFAGSYTAGAVALLQGADLPFGEVPSLAESDAPSETLDQLDAIQARAIVIDSYAISQDHIAALSGSGLSAVLIDDFARFPDYPCAVVLNFTVNAPQLPYPPGGATYLLGPSYFLVRRRLRQLRSRLEPRSATVRRILIAMGGTDRHNLSLRIVEALQKIAPGLVVRVVAALQFGAAGEMTDLLSGFAASSGLVANQKDLAEEFSLADACISGGGLTKYEAAYLGVPGAVLSQTAEQAEETVAFSARGLAWDLGLGPAIEPAQLEGGLRQFLGDAELRAGLVQTGLATFPADSTLRAAKAIAGCLSLN